MRTLIPSLRLCLILILAAASTGCVERTIRITSEPSGALVWLNDREIGRTPVDVGFVHYGTYDVRLLKEGYEPLHVPGEAKPPVWDMIGLDLAAELMPLELQSDVHWHYELEPARDDREGLVQRAEAIRDELGPGREQGEISGESAANGAVDG
jgi:hypothetical protein